MVVDDTFSNELAVQSIIKRYNFKDLIHKYSSVDDGDLAVVEFEFRNKCKKIDNINLIIMD